MNNWGHILPLYSSLNLVYISLTQFLCDEYFCAICRRLKKLAMIYWRKYIPMMRSEREKDIRRAEMRKRVHSWLPDFQTLTETSPWSDHLRCYKQTELQTSLGSLPRVLLLIVTPVVTQALQRSAGGVSTGAGKLKMARKCMVISISKEAF